MKAIVPSLAQFEVLRNIASAGFDYAATKRLCSGAGWQLVEDEPELGFVQYFLRVGPDVDDQRLLGVGIPEIECGPHLQLPLYYFDEESGVPSELERRPFDDSYRRLFDGMVAMLGSALRHGTYEYPHRQGWPYNYGAWRVPEAEVMLLQDEHDIQFGMDVSLWLFPAGTDVPVPLPY